MRLIMRHLRSVLALALLLGAATLRAEDITGKWRGQMPGRDGTAREMTFDLKADGAKLTGSMVGPGGRGVPITDGKVDADAVSFTVNLALGGNNMKMGYSGTVSGDVMKLKMQREGAPRSVEFTLKKVGS